MDSASRYKELAKFFAKSNQDAVHIPDPDTFTFDFVCAPSCQGTCCGHALDPTDHPNGKMIAISPADVYDLAQHLSLTMTQFTEQYCYVLTKTPDGHPWPFVILKDPADKKPCAFLTADKKCGVYKARPEACRSAPVIRMLVPDEDYQPTHELFWTPPHDVCQQRNGDTPARTWTATEFLAEHDVDFTKADDVLWLGWWAQREHRYGDWAIEDVARLIGPILYTPDAMVPAGTPTKEMFRRSIEATKLVIRELAVLARFARPDAAGALNANAIATRAERYMRDGFDTPQAGRNDPCPCRSGNKYKKCCGR